MMLDGLGILRLASYSPNEPRGRKAQVFLRYIHLAKVMESSDYGASFSGEVQTDGEPILFYGVDPAGGGADSVVKVVKRSGGSWGNPSTWDKGGKYLIQALTVVRERDYEMLITGRDDAEGYPWRLWPVVYGDGADVAAVTWSAISVLGKADIDLPFQYSHPTIRYLDVYRAAFVGSYTGSGGYERPHLMRTTQGSDFISSYWTEPAPVDLSTSYGAALAYDYPSQYVYLIGANFAQRAPVSGAASVDLSSRVVRYRATDGWSGDRAGQFRWWPDEHRPGLLRGGASRGFGRTLARVCHQRGPQVPPAALSLDRRS